MLKFYLYKKQIKLLKKFHKYELKRLFVRTLISDLRIVNNIRFYFIANLHYNDINLTKKKFICIKTYKYKGFMNFFNISRINFRENVSFGKYSGIKRFSW